MLYIPDFWTTHLGSVPHIEIEPICERLVASLNIPAWPQLSMRDFRENMYVQFSSTLPSVIVNETNEKIYFDTTGDITPQLENFYQSYLDDNFEAFALPPEYAPGFYNMLTALADQPGEWSKGQVTGPVSFGLTVADQDLRASLYNEFLADAIVKNMAMIARWQVQQLRRLRPNVMIFVDEPYLTSFGSAYINLSHAQVVAMLDEIFDAIHSESALAGVHCCGNTDWSVLLNTKVDILNLDAYGYIENLALYSEDFRQFLDRGGIIAWGIVPNNENIFGVNAADLAKRLLDSFNRISDGANARNVTISPEELSTRSILTPSCGLGSTTVEIADQAFDTLFLLGELLQK